MTSNHATWRTVAIDLQVAAEKLWPEIEGAFRAVGRGAGTAALREGLRYRGAFYLLAALAVENFAKALVAQAKARRNEPMSELDLLTLGRGEHLARVAEDAGLRLTSSERALLLRLTRTMRWRGRYPAPVLRQPNARGVRSIVGTGDLREIKRLLAKFEGVYQRTD